MCQIHGIMKVTHTMVFLGCPQVFKNHWLPGFHIVVRIEGGFTLTFLLKSFYTLEELSLCCVSFPSNDSGSFPIDLVVAHRAVLRKTSVASVHSLFCTLGVSVGDVL